MNEYNEKKYIDRKLNVEEFANKDDMITFEKFEKNYKDNRRNILIVRATIDKKSSEWTIGMFTDKNEFIRKELIAKGKNRFVDELNDAKTDEDKIKLATSYLHHDNIHKKVTSYLELGKKIEENNIQIDQKIRHAIFVEKGEYVNINTGDNKNYLRKKTFKMLYLSLFGAQVNLVRVMSALPTDMEINVCRINKAVMDVIGVDGDDVVVIESTSKTIKIRAVELTKDLETEAFNIIDDYIANGILGSAIDKAYPKQDVGNGSRKPAKNSMLPMILIDCDARKKLDIEPGDPVRVYRSVRDSFIINSFF